MKAIAAAVFVGLNTPVDSIAQDPASSTETAYQQLRRFDESGSEFLPLSQAGMAPNTVQEVFFATNRNPLPPVDPISFGKVVHAQTRFGSARMVSEDGLWQLESISVEPGTLLDALATPKHLAVEALRAATRESLAQRQLGIGQPMIQFAAKASRPESDLLVYVHGAGHDFESALSTTARLAELYRRSQRDIIPIVFTYPTNGISGPFNYYFDRRDAGMSGYAMSIGFDRLLEFLGELRLHRPDSRIWLMAHSLGAYATRVSVQSVFERSDQPPRVFDVTFLMGADEDHDTLSVEAKMRPILRLTNHLVVYFADNDNLLKLSVIANLRPPIGLRGPYQADTADYLGVEVYAIDSSDYSAVNDPWRAHGYYIRSPRVIEDVTAVIANTKADKINGRARVGARTFRLIDK